MGVFRMKTEDFQRCIRLEADPASGQRKSFILSADLFKSTIVVLLLNIPHAINLGDRPTRNQHLYCKGAQLKLSPLDNWSAEGWLNLSAACIVVRLRFSMYQGANWPVLIRNY